VQLVAHVRLHFLAHSEQYTSVTATHYQPHHQLRPKIPRQKALITIYDYNSLQ
jgi:hypothetical protein